MEMNRRDFLQSIGKGLAGASVVMQGMISVAREASSANKPNFLIFFADDLGEGDLSCYGHPALITPHIDRLAQEGMRFDNGFLTTSCCSPSRASLITGRYPHNTGAEDLHVPMPADQKSLAWYLRPAGYYCMTIGKWHVGGQEAKKWDKITKCPGRALAQNAVRMLRQRPRNKPFFCWVAIPDPHRPFDADAIPKPHTPDVVTVPPYLPDHPLIRKQLAEYYDEVVRQDDHVGLIYEELKTQNILDRTFIVYLSDNGMPFPRAKTTLYDSGIHTPLIFRYPPLIPRGTIQKNLASLIDIAPTILDLAGVPQNTMQGRSLIPMLKNPQASVRDVVFAEANWCDFEKFTRMVRTEKFALIRNYYWDKPLWHSVDAINSETWDGLMEMKKAGKLTPAQAYLFQEPRPFEEFYDLERDPYQLYNIIKDPNYRDSLYKLRTLLDNWRVETNDVMPEKRRPDGWTRNGVPLPHNQPWYDQYQKKNKGKQLFEKRF